MVLNGLGGVIYGAVIMLTPPSFGTPNNNCTGSFTVAWGAVANATSYILQRKTNGGAWQTIYTGPNLSLAQSGLAVGTYQYQIIAVKGSKQSEPMASGTVQVLAQGNVGAPFRSGNQLLQQVRSGCSLTNTVVATYGCTDPAASNYNASATINEGCIYPPISCNRTYLVSINVPAGTSKTYTVHWADMESISGRPPFDCTGGSGTIVDLRILGHPNGNELPPGWVTGVSGTYANGDFTITFTAHALDSYWYLTGYFQVVFTELQPN